MGPINSLFRRFQLAGSGFSTRVESQRSFCLIELILPGRTIQVHCRSVEKSKRLNRSVGTAVRSALDWRIAPCSDAIRKPASSSQSFLRDRSPLFTAALKQYATDWRISSYISTSRFLITSLCSLASALKLPMRHPFRQPIRLRYLICASTKARNRLSGGSESLRRVL